MHAIAVGRIVIVNLNWIVVVIVGPIVVAIAIDSDFVVVVVVILWKINKFRLYCSKTGTFHSLQH